MRLLCTSTQAARSAAPAEHAGQGRPGTAHVRAEEPLAAMGIYIPIAPGGISLPSQEATRLWTTLSRERERSSRNRAVCENQLNESVTMAMSFKNRVF